MLSINFMHVMWQQVGLISSVTMGWVAPFFFFFILGLNKTNKKILSSCAQIAADGAESLCLPQLSDKRGITEVTEMLQCDLTDHPHCSTTGFVNPW